MPDDDRLEDELRRAAERYDDLPQRYTDFALAALDLRTLDAELAELVLDSADQTEAAPVRGPDDCRMLTFHTDVLTIEMEIFDNGPDRRILGRLLPAVRLEIIVQRSDEEVTVSADELGRFALGPAAPGPLRLRCRLADGPTWRWIVTDWVTV